MNNNHPKTEENVPKPEPDWEWAKPRELPKPTYWPFFLAMGLTFIFWGFLTTWIIFLAGLIIFIIALIGWINIMRHDG